MDEEESSGESGGIIASIVGAVVGFFTGIFGNITKFSHVIFRLLGAVIVIVFIGTLTATQNSSPFLAQSVEDTGGDLRAIEVTDEERECFFLLLRVLRTMEYSGLHLENAAAAEFAKAYFPESYGAKVDDIRFDYDDQSVYVHYSPSVGNTEIELEFREWHIRKTVHLYHSFNEHNVIDLLVWYTVNRFREGYPIYHYDVNVDRYGQTSTPLIEKQMVKLKMFGMVTNIFGKLVRAFRS